MESGVVGDAIVRPPLRHIDAPLPEILEVLRGRLAAADRSKFETFTQLAEASNECDFLDLRRRIKWSFRLFSDGAVGREYVGRVGRSLPSKQELVHKELRFVADFLTLMQTAHYELLTKELWEIALREDFELTMPVTVDLSAMDSKMLVRFWGERPEQRAALPKVADRMLIFYRGISVGKKLDRFTSEKMDLLVSYLIVDPLISLYRRVRGIKISESRVGEIAEEGTETVKRVSLRGQLPDWQTVLRRLFSRIEILEPTFDSVVVLYRKAKATLLPSTPNSKVNRRQAKRNIVIKMFDSVPSADLEVIFPEKVVDIRKISWIYILLTVVLAVVSAVLTVWQTDIEMAVVGSALMLVFGKLFQSYTAMQREKATMMTNISKMLYDKTRDSQDGAVFSLLDDMADQNLKHVCVAYTHLLLATGKSLTVEELDRSCERFFEESFGRTVHFHLKEKLPHLLSTGLIQHNPDDKEKLIAVDLDRANVVLTEKWNGYHQKFGNLEAEESFLSSPATQTLTAGVNVVSGASDIGSSAAGVISTGLNQVRTFTQRFRSPLEKKTQ